MYLYWLQPWKEGLKILQANKQAKIKYYRLFSRPYYLLRIFRTSFKWRPAVQTIKNEKPDN